MRAWARMAGVVAAIGLVTGLAGCGPVKEPVPTTPRVTVPTATGPAMSAAAFRAKADAACSVLYSRLNAIGEPPSTDTAAAKAWYPKAAAAWHAHLDAIDQLVPPTDMQETWGRVVENYRKITQAADENVTLAGAKREAIELINSDPSAVQNQAGLVNVDFLRQLGLTGCTGGA